MLYYSPFKQIHLRSNTTDGITAIYFNTALRKFGLSLVGIFFPVFIFLKTQEVYGESIKIGLYGVVAYFFVWQLIRLLIILPTAKLITDYGFRLTLLMSNFFLAGLLILLILAEKNFYVLFPAAVLHAFATSLYWLSYHTLFAQDGIVDDLGKEVSTTKLIERLSGIAGPAVGGLIITFWGFSELFLVALLFVLTSAVPFFFMKKHEHDESVSFKEVVLWFKNKSHLNEQLGMLGRQIDDRISGIFYPIFAFLVLGTFSKQGLVEALSMGAGTLSVFLAGYVFDKRRLRKVFNLGVTFTAMFTLLRATANSLNSLLAIDVGRTASSPFYWVTFDSLWYRKSRREDENVLVFAAVNQVFSSIAAFVVMFIVVLIAGYDFRFWVIFGLAALGIIMSSALWKKGKKYE